MPAKCSTIIQKTLNQTIVTGADVSPSSLWMLSGMAVVTLGGAVSVVFLGAMVTSYLGLAW